MFRNLDELIKAVLKKLKYDYGVFYNISKFNNCRHAILKPPMGSDLPSFYVVFKRQWLITFNFKFESFVNAYPEWAGIGESLNKEWLELAISQRVSYLLFGHEEETIYQVSPLLFKKFVDNNNLYRTQERSNEYIRKDGSGMITTVKELTACIPVKLLERWN